MKPRIVEQQLAIFNSRYDGSTPTAVVTVKSPNDIQKAVVFATANNLKIVPRSGGHSYNGASTATGAVVLDLRQLPGGVSYDDATGRAPVAPMSFICSSPVRSPRK